VARSVHDWDVLRPGLGPGCQPSSATPAVDWAHDAVVLASYGPYASSCCGFGVHVDSVRPEATALAVYVRLDVPGAGCGPMTDDIISPSEAVAVPGASMRPGVRFVAHEERAKDCRR